jgi:hypothetical protein
MTFINVDANNDMKACDVYLMDVEYKEYEFKKFQNNFRSLKKLVKKHHD